jgi:hypothetical protein
MIAHVIENGVVVNTINVDSLDVLPNLVSGDVGTIGWAYDGVNLIDPNPPTPEQIAQQQAAALAMSVDDARAQRNALLAASDWTQVDDAPVDKAAWAAYRQALRDVPAQADFPSNIQWPTQPE